VQKLESTLEPAGFSHAEFQERKLERVMERWKKGGKFISGNGDGD